MGANFAALFRNEKKKSMKMWIIINVMRIKLIHVRRQITHIQIFYLHKCDI